MQTVAGRAFARPRDAIPRFFRYEHNHLESYVNILFALSSPFMALRLYDGGGPGHGGQLHGSR